ncbi:MAG: hypothetical protein RH948_06990 [Cyclobacteriaceae bacterium]
MINFLKFSALIFIFMLGIDRGFNYLLDQLYNETMTGQTGGKINHYLSLKNSPEILIMGNSRSLYQVIPESINPNSYNLSHAGMGLAFQSGLLSILSEKEKMPSIILLHLDPDDFTSDQRNSDIRNLKYYYGRNAVITNSINNLSRAEKFKYLFKLYRHNGRLIPLLKNYIQTLNTTTFSNGYESLMPKPQDSINTIYSSMAQKKLPEKKFDKNQLKLLNDFILLCQQSDTKLICFTSPVYFNPGNRYQITLYNIESFLASQEIPYINYLTNPIQPLQNRPSLWRDAFHLNDSGAKIESKSLKESIDLINTNYKLIN